MLTDSEHNEVVNLLLKAGSDKVQARQPSMIWPGITIEDAYAVSQAVAKKRVDAGGKIVGHKVGLTSRAMQLSSRINEPDFGHIFEDMVFNNGAAVNHSDYCVPRVEPELSFILKDRLTGPNVGLFDVLRATEYVVPSIEIIDSRLLEPRTICDTISDNGAAASVVLGGRAVRPDDVNLLRVGVVFMCNNEIEESGVSAGVLGHPALAVAWLANKLHTFGVSLEPGHLVLSGSFTRPVWAERWDTLHADFGSLGTVTVRFR